MRLIATISLILAGLGLAHLSNQTAHGCGGTPPPFFCAKTYVFAKGVQNANLPAARGGVVTIDTLHFANFIGIDGQCPPTFPASVSMTAALDCEPGPDAGPFNFGPFPIAEGFTEIPIDIPVPDGPPRVCIAQVTSTVTFADGMQVSQIADQQICLLPESKTEGGEPVLDVQLVGESLRCAHASDEHLFCFQVSNNSSSIFDGTFTVEMNNVADLPAVESGQNDTAVGVWALADPGGGDAYPLVVDDGQCVALPDEPHNAMSEPINGSVVLLPGESAEIKIKGRTWGLCANGSCGEAVFQVAGFLGDEAVTACAGFVTAVDNDKPAAFACSDSGRAVTDTFGSGGAVGPQAVLVAAPNPDDANDTTDVEFELDIAAMQLLINGTPITDGTPSFSGVTQVDGGFIRMVAEFSFIQPQAQPGDVITMINEILVNPDNPGTQEFISLGLVNGAPNGHEHIAPFAIGLINIDEGKGGSDPFAFNYIHQISAVGVEAGTFNQVPMQNLNVEITQLSDDRCRVTSDWQAMERGTSMIGFDVQNDFRAVARPVVLCPADLAGGDGVVNVFDLLELLANWGTNGPGADLAEPNDVVNVFDLLEMLAQWGTCE